VTSAASTAFLVFGGVYCLATLLALFRTGGRSSAGGGPQPAR
jgi:hypothetical protein